MRRMSGSIPTVDQENDLTYVKGYMLLIGAILFVVWELYALLFSKLMPHTGNWFLDAIKDVCVPFLSPSFRSLFVTRKKCSEDSL